MNTEEYISTGILEAYVLGDLTEAERNAVEENIIHYPALKEELEHVETVSEALFMKLSVPPPASVREKVMAAAKPSGKVVPFETSTVIRWKYAAAAAIVVALGAGYMAYDYHSKWKSTEFALNDLIAQNRQIAQDYNQVNQRLDKVENEIRVIDNPVFTKVVMKGTPNAPQAVASVYWNEQTKEVFLSIQNLRELSHDKQFQLWAIIDGKPVDAGVFDSSVAGLVKMKDIGKGAVTFAVTIEPRGGRPSPSLETMQVAGNVAKG